MTLEQIRIFLGVAELCHVTRAAERLNLTQSAVSAAIAALERQHDVKLFDRIGRGIMLTASGERLVPAARALLREAEAATALLSNLTTEPGGQLRLWASQTIASYWLTPRLLRMQETWPRVTMSVTAANTAEVAQAVLDGDADLGLVEGDVSPGILTQTIVGQDELVLVMARTHPLARKSMWRREDYRSVDWLLREPGSGTRLTMEGHLTAMDLGVEDLSILLELPTNEAILTGIGAGRAVAMVSRRSVPKARLRGLALRRIIWAPRVRRDFLALTDPRRFQTGAVRGFLNLL